MTNRTKGILCLILSAFFFSCMNLAVRLAGDLPSIQKSFFRNFVALIVAGVILAREGGSFRPSKGCLPWLILRSLFGTVGILCNFYAVDHLVLSDASMLNKMSPFFAALFSVILLKEKLNVKQLLAIVTAFAGSLLIIKPSFTDLAFLPALIGFIGGLGAGIAYTFVRYLTKKGEKKSFIVFFFSTFSCLVTLPWLIFDYHPMTANQLFFLVLAGLFGAGGQFSITSAYSFAPAREISVYDYSQIIFSALLGFFFFGQLPDAISIVGYFVILAAALYSFYINRKSDPKPAPGQSSQ